jgi:hypothetical protein
VGIYGLGCLGVFLSRRMGKREKRGGHADAVLHARLEVVRAETGLPEHTNHAMAANSVEQEIERESGEEEDNQTDA